jgi:Xaa-Pro aminopeptidase
VPGDARPDRQAAVRRRLEELGLDGLLVSSHPNIRYLSGFTGSAGLLLVFPDRTHLLTDFRYREQAPEETRGAAEVGCGKPWRPGAGTDWDSSAITSRCGTPTGSRGWTPRS